MPESLTDRLAFGLERAGAATATTVQAATFAAARLLAEPADGTVLVVPGRDSVDDGYGGVFAWDASSTAEDDNTDTLQIANVDTGRWVRVGTRGDGNDDYYNAQDSGFLPGADYEQTNGEALRAALEAAADADKRLKIPAGDYYFNGGTVDITQYDRSVYIFGDGPERTVLHYTGDAFALTLGGADSADNPYNATLHDFQITGTATALGAIDIYGAYATRLYHLWVNGDSGTAFSTAGVRIQDKANSGNNNALLHLRDLLVQGCAGDGIYLLDDVGASSVVLTVVRVQGNYGIGLHSPANDDPNTQLKSQVESYGSDYEGNVGGQIFANPVRAWLISGGHVENSVAQTTIPMQFGATGGGGSGRQIAGLTLQGVHVSTASSPYAVWAGHPSTGHTGVNIKGCYFTTDLSTSQVDAEQGGAVLLGGSYAAGVEANEGAGGYSGRRWDGSSRILAPIDATTMVSAAVHEREAIVIYGQRDALRELAIDWAATRFYIAGQHVANDSGKIYICTTTGTSAGSGGPTGTGTSITDGTCTWNYTTSYDATQSDQVVVYTGAAAFTVRAPYHVWSHRFCVVNDGDADVTIDRYNAGENVETFDGAATYTVAPGERVTFVHRPGSVEWRVVASHNAGATFVSVTSNTTGSGTPYVPQNARHLILRVNVLSDSDIFYLQMPAGASAGDRIDLQINQVSGGMEIAPFLDLRVRAESGGAVETRDYSFAGYGAVGVDAENYTDDTTYVAVPARSVSYVYDGSSWLLRYVEPSRKASHIYDKRIDFTAAPSGDLVGGEVLVYDGEAFAPSTGVDPASFYALDLMDGLATVVTRSKERVRDGGSTANNTPTNLSPTITVPDATGGIAYVDVIAHKSDGAATWVNSARVAYAKTGGTLTLGTVTLGTADTVGTTAGTSMTLVASSDNIVVEATGRNSETWRWSVRWSLEYRAAAA